MTRGKSLGPITTSATTAISASSDHAKSNIAACHPNSLAASDPCRPARQARAGPRIMAEARVCRKRRRPATAPALHMEIGVRLSSAPAWPVRRSLRRPSRPLPPPRRALAGRRRPRRRPPPPRLPPAAAPPPRRGRCPGRGPMRPAAFSSSTPGRSSVAQAEMHQELLGRDPGDRAAGRLARGPSARSSPPPSATSSVPPLTTTPRISSISARVTGW